MYCTYMSVSHSDFSRIQVDKQKCNHGNGNSYVIRHIPDCWNTSFCTCTTSNFFLDKNNAQVCCQHVVSMPSGGANDLEIETFPLPHAGFGLKGLIPLIF